ncbi:unnamed protein product [Ectocarpus sp. 12 AP-2014]
MAPSLTAEGRVQLGDAVRLFIQSIGDVNAVEKPYTRGCDGEVVVDFISLTFCSSANPSGHPYYELVVRDLRQYSGGIADRNVVRDFVLAPDHALSISETLGRKRGVSVIHVTVHPDAPQSAHSCLLVFDARTRRQHFFNPWGNRNHWLSRAFAEKTPPLVQGFTVASLNEDNWASVNQSLQYRVDRNHYNVRGNCTIYCMLIAVLCTRFNFGKPRLMANLLKDALRDIDAANGFDVENDDPASSHMSILWNWASDLISDAQSLADSVVLDANSVVTPAMWSRRKNERSKALYYLNHFPPLADDSDPGMIMRRQRLRSKKSNFINTHAELVVGAPISYNDVAEHNREISDTEARLVKRMFPPAETCAIVTRKGRPCTRKSCHNQPLCWQHRFYTRNHVLTGPGRMRCSAVQQPC